MGKGAGNLNQEKIVKKLESVTISQDSIQSTSSYLLMYKKWSDKIVETWLSVLRKSSENRRLILFYVANELLQTCRQKNASGFKASWKKFLPKATELVKDTAMAPKIERIMNIWEERRVYDPGYISELKKMLLRQEYITPVTKTRIADPKKVVEEYSPEAGIEVLRKCSIVEEDTKFKLKQLDQSKLDFSNLDAVRKLKDRAHGREFSQMFDESYTALEEYVKSLETELEQRKKLLETLERAEVFYDNQYHDAAVVADAYLKYGHRVNGMKQRANDFLDNMPDEDIPSEDVEDAPSPGNTPPHMRMMANDMGTLDSFDRRSSNGEDMDLSDEEVRSEGASRIRVQRGPLGPSAHAPGDEDYGRHEDDRYSPSGALPSAESRIEPSTEAAAAAAAMRIVSGYRPPLNVHNPSSQKMQPTRDPRIHGLQLGIPPPPPPPPLAPHLHPRGPPLFPPSLLSAAVALQNHQAPPPPPRAGTPVRDEQPEGNSQRVDGAVGDGDGAGGSTPTQDEPPESMQPEPPTPNTAINFLSNFIQLNTNPTVASVQNQQPSPAIQSIPGLWNSAPNPPPLPPPQPPQTQPSVAAAVRLLSPQLMTQNANSDPTAGLWPGSSNSQPPPPPVPESVGGDSWPRAFHLPPPPPPPTATARIVAAAAHAAAQFAAGQTRLPQPSPSIELGQSFGTKSPIHVSPPIRQPSGSALRQLPLVSESHEGDQRPSTSTSQESDDNDSFDKFPARNSSPDEEKLPGLGNFGEEITSGSKDVETGENEGHEVLLDRHDEDDRDMLPQQDRFNQERLDHPNPMMHMNPNMQMHEDMASRGNFPMPDHQSRFEQSQQLHRIQTIGGNVPHMRQMHQQLQHGLQSQQFRHAGPEGRFMGGGVGPRPPRFGTGGARGNFAPRHFWQHSGGGPRGFRGQYRPIGPRF